MAQQPKKTKINNYQAILQPAVSLDDSTWSYTLPDLPPPPDTNRLGLVKAISVKTDGTTHAITLRLQPVSSNRALRGDPLDKFILVSFADFHSRSLRNATPPLIGTQPATPRECTDYMVKLLRAGITLQDVHYNFYGHSNSQLPPTELYPMLVQNALCQSHLVDVEELGESKLNYPGIRWKRIFSSHEGRIGGFMEATAKAMELFDRKLIVYRVDERLTLGLYVPMRLEKAQDSRVDDKVRLLAFPHSQGEETTSRLMLPTKKNYQLYYDDNSFQLYENQRANTWVFSGRGASDDSRYRNVEGVGDQRRVRQTTLDDGTNFDFVSSVALNKFSSRLQRHVGRVRRNGVLGAVC